MGGWSTESTPEHRCKIGGIFVFGWVGGVPVYPGSWGWGGQVRRGIGARVGASPVILVVSELRGGGRSGEVKLSLSMVRVGGEPKHMLPC